MTISPVVATDHARPSESDIQLLFDYIRQEGITPVPVEDEWSHIGAVIADASLQAGIG